MAAGGGGERRGSCGAEVFAVVANACAVLPHQKCSNGTLSL
jgi:hypothetical protein